MKKVIMIVTENHEFEILLESFLSGSFEVKVARCNYDAISEIKNGFVPGLVISDRLTPVSECQALIQSLKVSISNTQIPIILMAGKDKSCDLNDLMKKGATDYIYKPFSLSELETRILNLFKKKVVPA